RELCTYPIDAFHYGDDWGQQYGLIMGIELWRKFFRPRLRKLYDEVHKAGLPVSIHSCGDISEIIPDLIEMGVNMITPLQAEALDFKYLKKEYGRNLTFWGGVSTQKTFPYGTPADVRAEVRERIKVLGTGGGYIIAPSHELQGDVPLENMLAFIDEVQNQTILKN
ncbi:MAG: uroporphyrinogen decarboxylase family protein, partial [Methanosarcina sp.]